VALRQLRAGASSVSSAGGSCGAGSGGVGRAGRREPSSAGHAPPTDRQTDSARRRGGRKNKRPGGLRPGGLDKARGNLVGV